MAASDRVRRISFSSEAPVERWFGNEILDHGKGSVRMDWLNSGRAPLLMGHNHDRQVGVIDAAILGRDRKGYADVRFGRSAYAEEKLRDVDDGILVNTSVGYRIHELALEGTKDGVDTYRVIDWEPFEASLVGVPADTSVGVGRIVSTTTATIRSATMTKEVTSAETPALNRSANGGETEPVRVEITREAPPPARTAKEVEQERIETIRNMCKGARIGEETFNTWVREGASLNKISQEIVSILAQRQEVQPTGLGHLDMPARDVRQYSTMRALRAAMNKDWRHAGLELDASNAVREKIKQIPRAETSFFVPLDVLMRDLPGTFRRDIQRQNAQRDMTVAGVSGSNFLVSTDNLPGSFIDLLRNTSVGLAMGVQRLGGLVGNVTIPKMTAGNTAFWLADENTQITESQPTIGQLTLSVKNIAALTELSHQLLAQSTPDAEQLVLTSIARDIGLAVDVGILRGSGAAGQPTGITNTAGIGAFTGTSLAATGVLNAISDVGAANALFPGCGFATTHAVAALLMDRPNLTGATDGTPLWQGRMEDGTIRGYRAMASGQMASATMLFGWWPSVVLAEWGVLELMVNPFSDFTRGLTAVRGWFMCDVGVRYAGAWSLASTIT